MGVRRFTPIMVAGLLATALPASVDAQVSERRVREAVEDAARGLGQAVAGGSPLTGPAGALGGLGHFQIGVAGAVTRMEIEDPREEEGTVEFYLPVGTVQGAVGITKGSALGLGAIDLVARAGPVVAREEYRESELLMSVGARVGILAESPIAPAVSATVARSWVDGLEWGDPDGDEVHFAGDVSTLSARLDVSKSFLLLSPYAGVGIDRTAIDAEYRIPPSQATGGSEIRGSFDTSSTHHKAYAGVELGFLLLKATFEAGVYDGGAFAAAGVRAGL